MRSGFDAIQLSEAGLDDDGNRNLFVGRFFSSARNIPVSSIQGKNHSQPTSAELL
jgi:hypothetical protein